MLIPFQLFSLEYQQEIKLSHIYGYLGEYYYMQNLQFRSDQKHLLEDIEFQP